MRRTRLWLHGLDAALQRPWVKRGMVGVICGWAFLATVGAGAALITQASDHRATVRATSAATRATDALAIENAQILHACERDNVKTANDNASHWGDFNVFTFVDDRFSVPTKSETAAQKQITAQFAGKLQSAIAAKDWSPLTNCRAAVAVGPKYTATQPVSFTKGPPPPSQLSPTNAALPDPVGSVP